jgi:hypothetical protein
LFFADNDLVHSTRRSRKRCPVQARERDNSPPTRYGVDCGFVTRCCGFYLKNREQLPRMSTATSIQLRIPTRITAPSSTPKSPIPARDGPPLHARQMRKRTRRSTSTNVTRRRKQHLHQDLS